jgi:hypothetical protein
MPAVNNEIDLSGVGDVVLHIYYTALDGGDPLKQAVQANNAANLPTAGIKVFSALNDFSAPSPTAANPYPVAPWQSFLAAPAAGADQVLTLAISPSKFPPWTRGKIITVTGLTVLAVSWVPGNFVVEPQAPLPSTDITMAPVPNVTEPNVCSGIVTVPPAAPVGTGTFKLRKQSAGDFHSLTKNDIGDALLLVSFQVSPNVAASPASCTPHVATPHPRLCTRTHRALRLLRQGHEPRRQRR